MNVMVNIILDLDEEEDDDAYENFLAEFASLELGDDIQLLEGKHDEQPWEHIFVGEYQGVTDVNEFAETVWGALKATFEECCVQGRVYMLVAGKSWVWRTGEP